VSRENGKDTHIREKEGQSPSDPLVSTESTSQLKGQTASDVVIPALPDFPDVFLPGQEESPLVQTPETPLPDVGTPAPDAALPTPPLDIAPLDEPIAEPDVPAPPLREAQNYQADKPDVPGVSVSHVAGAFGLAEVIDPLTGTPIANINFGAEGGGLGDDETEGLDELDLAAAVAGAGGEEEEDDLPPLFTPDPDTVDFNTVVAGTYIDGTQYDALESDDVVTLFDDAGEAAEAGYDLSIAFRAGGWKRYNNRQWIGRYRLWGCR